MSHELRIKRRFSASAQDVYEAWTDPESLAQWMLPMPRCETQVRADVRVGGYFEIDMVTDGAAYPHHGEYLRLESPSLIEFTWISGATHGLRSVVRVELRPIGADETELTLTQRQLPDERSAQEHHAGWSVALDLLTQRFPSRRTPCC